MELVDVELVDVELVDGVGVVGVGVDWGLRLKFSTSPEPLFPEALRLYQTQLMLSWYAAPPSSIPGVFCPICSKWLLFISISDGQIELFPPACIICSAGLIVLSVIVTCWLSIIAAPRLLLLVTVTYCDEWIARAKLPALLILSKFFIVILFLPWTDMLWEHEGIQSLSLIHPVNSFEFPFNVIPSLPTIIPPSISAVTLHVLELESQVPMLVQSPPFAPSVTVNVPEAFVGPEGIVSVDVPTILSQ